MSQSAPRRNVSYIKPSEPTFLKAFKAKAGYKDSQVTIETKREELKREEGEEAPFREDELPVMVKGTGVSEDEYKQFVQETKREGHSILQDDDSIIPIKEHTDTPPLDDGKIMFKKPTKRTSSQVGGVSSSHLLKTSSSKRRHREEKEVKSSNSKSVSNKTLLSFEDEQDDSD